MDAVAVGIDDLGGGAPDVAHRRSRLDACLAQQADRVLEIGDLEAQMHSPGRGLANAFVPLVQGEPRATEVGFLPVLVALEWNAEQVAVERARLRHVADVEVDDVEPGDA